jgi:hypothetical protein
MMIPILPLMLQIPVLIPGLIHHVWVSNVLFSRVMNVPERNHLKFLTLLDGVTAANVSIQAMLKNVKPESAARAYVHRHPVRG